MDESNAETLSSTSLTPLDGVDAAFKAVGTLTDNEGISSGCDPFLRPFWSFMPDVCSAETIGSQ